MEAAAAAANSERTKKRKRGSKEGGEVKKEKKEEKKEEMDGVPALAPPISTSNSEETKPGPAQDTSMDVDAREADEDNMHEEMRIVVKVINFFSVLM